MAATVRVWDPLVRVFHWSLVASFAVAWISADEWDDLHIWAGYAAAALIALPVSSRPNFGTEPMISPVAGFLTLITSPEAFAQSPPMKQASRKKRVSGILRAPQVSPANCLSTANRLCNRR